MTDGKRQTLALIAPVPLMLLLGMPSACAQSTNELPMDPIPHELELPDPCDNATTRLWGPDDELGNLNYLTPDRVAENLSLIRLGKVYELSQVLDPGQMGFMAYFETVQMPFHG